MALTQAMAEALHETALKVDHDELSALGAWSIKLGLGLLMDTLDEAIAEAEPFARAGVLYQEVNGILARWFNDEIDPRQVLRELEPLLPEIEALVRDAERILTSAYGVGREELAKHRQDVVDTLKEITEPAE